MELLAKRVTTGAGNEYLEGPNGARYELGDVEWIEGRDKVAPFGRIVKPGRLPSRECWILPEPTYGTMVHSVYAREEATS